MWVVLTQLNVNRKSKVTKIKVAIDVEGRSPYRYSGVSFVPMECDVSIRFLYLQPSRGPHESIITSFKKLQPSFLLRTVKCRFLARAFVRASNALARVMPRAKF